MTKRRLLTMATVMAVLGSAVAIKSFIPATPTVVRQAAAPAAPAAAISQRAMEIRPAPVIDTHAKIFIGTGDGSAGSWDKP